MYSRENPPTTDDVLDFFTKLSNHGRWGADDELGTLNLITPEARKRGAAAVRHGISVSCSWEVPTGAGGIERKTQVRVFPPAEQPWGGGNEHITFDCHDAIFTHLDAVCHIFWDGGIYNGRRAVDVLTPVAGAEFGAITAAAGGLVTRGVLLDIPAARGVDWLEHGEAVHPEDLLAAEERQGVRVEAGDAVLLRTGFDRRRHETEELLSGSTGQAGWHASCLPWIRERDVAYIGCDTGQDAIPSGYPTIFLPIHTCAQAAMGMWLVDHCDLWECARTAEQLQQWDFLLSVSPVRIQAGTGSPVNPIATF